MVHDDLHQRDGYTVVLHRHDKRRKCSVPPCPVPDGSADVFDVEILVDGDSLELVLSPPSKLGDGDSADEEDTAAAWWSARLIGGGRHNGNGSVIAKLKAVPAADGGATWSVKEQKRDKSNMLTSARLYCSCEECHPKVKSGRARMCVSIVDPDKLHWKCTLINAHSIPALEAPGATAAAQLPSAVLHSAADPENLFPSMIAAGINLRQTIAFYKSHHDTDIARDDAEYTRVKNYWQTLVKDSTCAASNPLRGRTER